jgi:DNA adenine methylase
MKKKLRPPVKTHGGKFYLCDFIISHFPENHEKLTYCEPMCAGASVFLNKTPSEEEVINDIDAGLISVYKSLRDEPTEFIDRLNKIKYNEKTFKTALARAEEPFDDYIEQAVNEYMLRRMSRGGMKKAFAWSDRLRGGQPGDVNAWETMLEELPRIAERVKKTVILNKSVFEVFKIWDEEDTLMYLDPPYLHETRSDGATNAYEHEMSVEDHINLLTLAKGARSKVIISGYSSPLYNRNLKGWKVKKKNVANHSGQSKTKERRTECLWMNY